MLVCVPFFRATPREQSMNFLCRCYAQLSFHHSKRVMFFSQSLGGSGDFFFQVVRF